jgi:hypothetical protein
VVKAWRTHERERMGGSQRSEGHGYGPGAPVARRFPSTMTCRVRIPATYLHSPLTQSTKQGSFERLLPPLLLRLQQLVSYLAFSFALHNLPNTCVWAACLLADDWNFAMTWCQERHKKEKVLLSSREYTVPILRNRHQN